ncbi:MAG: RDD family protein [Chitinophagaceae bacterium]|nr:RDD family protein [Chitinophagaceae bacterium]
MTNTKKYIGRRVGATIIDYTLIFILTFMYIWFAGEPNEEGGRTVTGFPALVPIVFWFLYFVVIESSYSSTFGHLLVGLKVVSLDGSNVTFGQILKRRLADIIEIAWCFGLVAFLVAKGNENSQRVGDILAKTTVVGKNDSTENSEFEFEKPL